MHEYDDDNIFLKIINHEIPCDKIFENDDFLCFRDIAPQAPIHLLLVSKNKKVPSLANVIKEDASWLGEMIVLSTQIAKDQGLDLSGYRLVINCGHEAGQTVYHLHLHIIGGKKLSGSMT